MTPIGPYIGKWARMPHYIVSCLYLGEIAYSCVPNGTPANEGTIHSKLIFAKRWMEQNGFTLQEKQDLREAG